MKTRFQKIINNPSNTFDYNMIDAHQKIIDSKEFEHLPPVRDAFNKMSDFEYKWYVENHSKAVSLDDVLTNITEMLRKHLQDLAKKNNDEIGTMVTDMVIAIAPWHTERSEVNKRLRKLNLKSWVAPCKKTKVLLKDLIIDALEVKLKIAEEALGIVNRQIEKDQKIILNETKNIYEVV